MGAESGRVGSDFLSAIAGRVGSGRVESGRVGSRFRWVGSGRVQEKWPVDNSVATGKAPGPSLEQGSRDQISNLGAPRKASNGGPRDMAQNGT